MNAIIFLADAAQVAEGKLSVLGGGWQTTTSPLTAPAGVALIIQIPWDETNRKHRFKLELLTADGKPVLLPTGPNAFAPILIGQEFEVGRPPGIKQGSPINMPWAVQLGPMPLPPDESFEWKLTIDEKSKPEWRVAFATRPLQQAPFLPSPPS